MSFYTRLRSAFVGLALLVGSSLPALAHPHVFVDARLEVRFDADGRVAALRHVWRFDDAFSAFASQGLDTNGDGFRDSFDNVRAGTPVCWKLVSKPNTTVPATNEPQLFRATVVVTGDGVTELDRRDVFFLVPPVPQDPPIG